MTIISTQPLSRATLSENFIWRNSLLTIADKRIIIFTYFSISCRAIFPWKTNYKTMFTDIVQWYYETPQDFPVNTSQLQAVGSFWSLLWWNWDTVTWAVNRSLLVVTLNYLQCNIFSKLLSSPLLKIDLSQRSRQNQQEVTRMLK